MVTDYLIVQISDVHLTLDGNLPPGVRPRENLLRGLDLLRASRIHPDVFILTGDLADSGAGACYEDLAQIFAEVAGERGAGVIFVPGNHDDRAEFRRHLLGADPSTAPINQVHRRDGLRIISLDSSIPGEDDGALDNATLGFLTAELATSAPDGTVVVLHHPPVPSPIEPMSRLRLRNPDALREAIAGSDVRIVISGHNHHEAVGHIGSVPVWVSPSSAYRADVTKADVFRGLAGSAFSRIDLLGAELLVTVVTVPPEMDLQGAGARGAGLREREATARVEQPQLIRQRTARGEGRPRMRRNGS
jgi:3',5'-cyclic AMP phosphodiesterase CpdA